jgi:hypothetical protein
MVCWSGEKLYSLAGDDKQFNKLAGKRVNIIGEVHGTKIAVQSINTAE